MQTKDQREKSVVWWATLQATYSWTAAVILAETCWATESSEPRHEKESAVCGLARLARTAPSIPLHTEPDLS